MSRVAILAVAGLLALACGVAFAGTGDQTAGARPTPLIAHGAQLYAANCSTCHGPQGGGNPMQATGSGGTTGFGPSLRGVGALAADFYLRTGYMPLQSPYVQPRRSRVLFSERDIRALVAYVASLGRGPAIPDPQPQLGNVSAGLRLFTEHCAGCHQVTAAGGYVPDSVAPALPPDSPRQIAEAVRIGPNLMPRFSRSQLSDRQLDSVIAYVGYARQPYDRGGWALGHVGPVPEGLVAWFVAGIVLVGVSLTVGRRLA